MTEETAKRSEPIVVDTTIEVLERKIAPDGAVVWVDDRAQLGGA